MPTPAMSKANGTCVMLSGPVLGNTVRVGRGVSETEAVVAANGGTVEEVVVVVVSSTTGAGGGVVVGGV